MIRSKVRYCRHCHKELPQTNWFFCNNRCGEKYERAETADTDRYVKQWLKTHKDPELMIMELCGQCSRKCKIHIDSMNYHYSFMCMDYTSNQLGRVK